MGWNFYNASGELQINDGGVSASAAVFTGNVDLGSNLLVGNAGSTGIAISANGEVTMAAQPCVLAFNSATDANVTGNNAWATLDADTEVFDQNADFASDTFTAPVTGRYLVSAGIDVGGLVTGSTNFYWEMVASNRTVEMARFNRSSGSNIIDRWKSPGSVVVDMDAADTAYVRINVDGDSSDSADIEGNSTVLVSWISVVLVA